MSPLVALTVAGTDSGGAAGVAADLTTFAALGAHGACVITAVTAQDTTGVSAVHPVPDEIVDQQLNAVLDDLPVAVVKTGMLGTAEVVRLVAARAAGLPVVVDPVLVATSGAVLGDEKVAAAYLHDLFPIAAVVTPNADEAKALLGADAPPRQLAEALARAGPTVVVTGGGGDDRFCTDWVAAPGEPAVPLRHAGVDTDNDHGTGCTFSAALAVQLARGATPAAAAGAAAAFTVQQLRTGSGWRLGRGRGPIAHTTPPSGHSIGAS
jgi:hydroxymethylpyrimidine/phosphomethylpyrimidine kinase